MPGGKSISTIFVSVSNIVLSVHNDLIEFSHVDFSWSFRLVISEFLMLLKKNLIVILSIIGI